MVEPGRRRLGDRYELDHMIAAGGMGQVWRGVDTALHRSVAVKVLRSEYTGDSNFLARFRAEAQHAASLSHPHVAAVFDYGEETAQDGSGETLAYLVMELVEGEALSAMLAREGALSTDTTLRLLQQTAFALAEAHRMGLVHRDVKPGNILVRDDGSVKITDFGIAWSARSVALTRTGQVIGTPQYLSPEQAEGRLASPASDVYALGLIGYECLSGHPAFDGDNAVTIALKQVQQEPEPLPGGLPPGVRTLITQALVKNPAARIPDGAAFAAAIDDVLAGRMPAAVAAPPTRDVAALPPGEVVGPTSGSAVRSPPVPRRGRRMALALLPLVALLAGGGIAAGVLQALSDGTPAATAVAAEQRDSGSILLEAADHVGQPVDEVTERLTALGLVVELRAQTTADVPRDRVTNISPTGLQLRPGDVVVLQYAVPPARTGQATEGRTGSSGVVTVEAAPEPVAPSDPEPVAPEPVAPVPVAPVPVPEPTLQASVPSSPTVLQPTPKPSTPASPTVSSGPTTPTAMPPSSPPPPPSSPPKPTTKPTPKPTTAAPSTAPTTPVAPQ